MTKMSQHKNTEPCENMPLILISLKKEQFCQDQYLFNPFIRKTRCPTYICMPLYPTPQYDNNKAHFFFLGTTFDFPFLSSFGFWRCNNKKQSNKYTITYCIADNINYSLPVLFYILLANYLISYHPWCKTKWLLMGDGRLLEMSRK